MLWVLSLSDSRAPNLGRSTCTTISGCYSPANPSKWTQGSLMSWNLSPRCQETLNTLPGCDPSLTLWPFPTQPLLCFQKRREGSKQTARMMDTKLDKTWWDTPHAHKTHMHISYGGGNWKSPPFLCIHSPLKMNWDWKNITQANMAFLISSKLWRY